MYIQKATWGTYAAAKPFLHGSKVQSRSSIRCVVYIHIYIYYISTYDLCVCTYICSIYIINKGMTVKVAQKLLAPKGPQVPEGRAARSTGQCSQKPWLLGAFGFYSILYHTITYTISIIYQTLPYWDPYVYVVFWGLGGPGVLPTPS